MTKTGAITAVGRSIQTYQFRYVQARGNVFAMKEIPNLFRRQISQWRKYFGIRITCLPKVMDTIQFKARKCSVSLGTFIPSSTEKHKGLPFPRQTHNPTYRTHPKPVCAPSKLICGWGGYPLPMTLTKNLSFRRGLTILVMIGSLSCPACRQILANVLLTYWAITGISTPVSQYSSVTGLVSRGRSSMVKYTAAKRAVESLPPLNPRYQGRSSFWYCLASLLITTPISRSVMAVATSSGGLSLYPEVSHAQSCCAVG